MYKTADDELNDRKSCFLYFGEFFLLKFSQSHLLFELAKMSDSDF